MEMMRQQQTEAIRKRQEELEKLKVEQAHVLAIRRVLQKFRAATPSTFEACKTELDEALAKDLEGCGTQKERVMAESEQTIVQTKQRMEQLAAEMERRKEQKAKALELLAQLEQEVVKCEEKAKGVVEELEPLTGGQDLSISGIESAVTAVEEAAKEASAQAEICTEFIRKDAVSIKSVPQIDGEEPHTLANDLNALTARIVNAKTKITNASNTTKTEKAKRIKMAQAKEELDAIDKTLKKYANKSGDLGRKEVKAFAKGEFKFVLPDSSLDSICRVLMPEGSKTIANDSYRMLAMIGIAR
jgi:chromosome segregation ATPase